MPVPRSTTRRPGVRAGLVLTATAAVVVGIATPSFATVTPAVLTLSSNAGPSAGGNTITATTPTYTTGTPPVLAPTFSGGASIEFQAVTSTATACASTYATAVTPTGTNGGIIVLPAVDLTIISANRIAMAIPTGFFSGASTTTPPKYNICAYSGTTSGSTLLAQTTSTGGQYSIGAQAGIGTVTPSAGSVQGGTTITVTGTSFPTTSSAISASIGGTPLLNITAVSPTSFTAVTPPHAVSGALPLTVTTAGGSVTKASMFTYSYGITVSPNSGPNSRATGTPIDVQGLGFSALTFANTDNPDDTNAHVYLVRGAYDSALSGQTKGVGETSECGSVLVVSDTELVCTMNLAASLDLTTSGTTAMNTHDVSATTSNTSTAVTGILPVLTAADVGQRAMGDGLVNGTTIFSQAGATAVLSLATGGSGTGAGTITIGAGTVAATATSGSANLTAISPSLSASDVGKVVTGTGIPAGTTILSQTGTAAVLSVPAVSTATGSSGTFTIGNAVPVPIGTYTVTVVSNGAGDQQNDTNFTKSIISSGSTFTVADY